MCTAFAVHEDAHDLEWAIFCKILILFKSIVSYEKKNLMLKAEFI